MTPSTFQSPEITQEQYARRQQSPSRSTPATSTRRQHGDQIKEDHHHIVGLEAIADKEAIRAEISTTEVGTTITLIVHPCLQITLIVHFVVDSPLATLSFAGREISSCHTCIYTDHRIMYIHL